MTGLIPAYDELDLDLVGGGTHPFAAWSSHQLPTAGLPFASL